MSKCTHMKIQTPFCSDTRLELAAYAWNLKCPLKKTAQALHWRREILMNSEKPHECTLNGEHPLREPAKSPNYTFPLFKVSQLSSRYYCRLQRDDRSTLLEDTHLNTSATSWLLKHRFSFSIKKKKKCFSFTFYPVEHQIIPPLHNPYISSL